MESVYLDTSALVKRYVEEEGTARVIDLTKDGGSARVIILDVALLESRSAVRRREREGAGRTALVETVAIQPQSGVRALGLRRRASGQGTVE